MNTKLNSSPLSGFRSSNRAAFTMVELALALAVIGFALVAILRVLPIGLNTQRDNREDTIINQDAALWMDAIRSGRQGIGFGVNEELSNYVVSITKTVVTYDSSTMPWTYVSSTTVAYSNLVWPQAIGLLSTPRYHYPTANTVLSNTITADVRAMTGSGVTRWPQDNELIKDGAFTYRLTTAVDVVESAPPSGAAEAEVYNRLRDSVNELRLNFRFPVLPNGNVGFGRRIYRASVGGTMLWVAPQFAGQPELWFYQPNNYSKQP